MQKHSDMEPIPFLDLSAQYRGMREEIDEAVSRVLESGQFIGGEEVAELETEIARFCGAPHGLGLNSGTDALLLALKALGIGAGDEVITTAFSYIATVSAIVNAGAKPVFVDICPGTFNLDSSQIERAITPRTKAILPVHLFGQVAEGMEEIAELAAKHGLFVIEDAAQAIGAERNGRRSGSFGDAACLSFFPTKNLGAYGDGGMLLAKNGEVSSRAHVLARNGGDLNDKYLNREVGVNSRLDALQAAILRVKLKRLPEWNEARQMLANQYREELGKVSAVSVPETAPGNAHVFHQYTIRVPNRDDLRAHLAKRGIQTFVFYSRPLHLQPAMAFLGHKEGDFPQAERASREVLSLPIFPELSFVLQERIIREITMFFS